MRTAPSILSSWLAPLLLSMLLVGCGPKSLKERTRHGEKLSDEAASLLKDARRLWARVSPTREAKARRELEAGPPQAEALRMGMAAMGMAA